MASLVVVVKGGCAGLIEKIEDALSPVVRLSREPRGEWDVIGISFSTQALYETGEAVLRARLGEIIENFILSDFREFSVKRLIKQDYYYFSSGERDRIFHYSTLQDSSVGKETRISAGKALSDYLKNCRHLNVNGFVRFRLQDYLTELRTLVERAVDEYLMEKEYQEFIKLLRYFVDIQEPKVMEAHVLVNQKGLFQIRDGKQKVLEQDNEEINAPYLKNQVGSEDMLVSALVTAAPAKVVIHRPVDERYPRLTGNLRKIFDTRMVLCRSCKECIALARAAVRSDG